MEKRGNSHEGLIVLERPFLMKSGRRNATRLSKPKESTKKIGRKGERVAQKWLWAHRKVKSRPATLIANHFGTWPVDLYDIKSAWVYEVKMGRVGLHRAAHQGFDLGRMLFAGLIRGATMISIENKGKSGFSKSAKAFLKRARVDTLVIKQSRAPLKGK